MKFSEREVVAIKALIEALKEITQDDAPVFALVDSLETIFYCGGK